MQGEASAAAKSQPPSELAFLAAEHRRLEDALVNRQPPKMRIQAPYATILRHHIAHAAPPLSKGLLRPYEPLAIGGDKPLRVVAIFEDETHPVVATPVVVRELHAFSQLTEKKRIQYG